jgi:hypothetical protein
MLPLKTEMEPAFRMSGVFISPTQAVRKVRAKPGGKSRGREIIRQLDLIAFNRETRTLYVMSSVTGLPGSETFCIGISLLSCKGIGEGRDVVLISPTCSPIFYSLFLPHFVMHHHHDELIWQ